MLLKARGNRRLSALERAGGKGSNSELRYLKVRKKIRETKSSLKRLKTFSQINQNKHTKDPN